MKTIEMVRMCGKKVIDVSEIAERKSSNKNPDYYKTLKELKLWKVLKEVLECYKEEYLPLDGSTEQIFNELIEGGNKKNIIHLEEGDDVIEYMSSHPTVKYENIKKYLEKEGLTLKGSKVSK